MNRERALGAHVSLAATSRLLAVVLVASGCSRCAPPPVEPPPPPLDEAPATSPPSAPETVVVHALTPDAPDYVIEPAFRPDDAGNVMVRARRLVYRFTVRLPWGLGQARSDIATPTGELRVDVAGKRLRAQFVGTGFPVDEGSEVRMRVDLPGTYVFDGRGGRPVGTGQLAAWFQSGPGARGVEMTVRDSAPDETVVVDLVCRLFGEWAGASIASVRRTCGADGLPTRMTFGPYRVERTAEAVIELPERSMRADDRDPPEGLTHVVSTRLHAAETLARLSPSVDDPPERRPRAGEPPVVVTNGVRIENRTGARVLIAIDGVALGWVDPGAPPIVYEGMPPGGYVIGAMMPLGGSASYGRAYRLPTRVILERTVPPGSVRP